MKTAREKVKLSQKEESAKAVTARRFLRRLKPSKYLSIREPLEITPLPFTEKVTKFLKQWLEILSLSPRNSHMTYSPERVLTFS